MLLSACALFISSMCVCACTYGCVCVCVFEITCIPHARRQLPLTLPCSLEWELSDWSAALNFTISPSPLSGSPVLFSRAGSSEWESMQDCSNSLLPLGSVFSSSVWSGLEKWPGYAAVWACADLVLLQAISPPSSYHLDTTASLFLHSKSLLLH